MSKHVRI